MQAFFRHFHHLLHLLGGFTYLLNFSTLVVSNIKGVGKFAIYSIFCFILGESSFSLGESSKKVRIFV